MLCCTFGVASFALTACHDSSTAPPPPDGGPPRSPTLSIAHDTTLLVDETFPVPVTALDTLGRPIVSPSITWRSSAPGVASVDGWGHVEALALGSAVITATMDSLEARATITVVPQFTQIVAGTLHTCGITTSHDAYCSGWDDSGQLGAGDVSAERCTFAGTNPCSRTPRLVVGAHQWAQLSATERATCGITTTGELYCWGLGVGGSDGLYCQTPDNLVNCTRTPTLVASSKSYEATGIGGLHRCEQALDGTLDCWGANAFGVFGDGTRETYSPIPVIAAGGTAYASFVSTRLGTLCALTGDGRAQCWGRGREGEIGNGLFEDVLIPTDVSGGHHFAALASSGSSDYVCGIVTETGCAYCWGLGADAQLGDGEFRSRSEPVLVRLVR
jgi:alpha-tubulin suppressor-like RCC1 family protein